MKRFERGALWSGGRCPKEQDDAYEQHGTDAYGQRGVIDNAAESHVTTSGAEHDAVPQRQDVMHAGVDGERSVT